MDEKDLIKKDSELILLDETAKNVITYSEDDRRKADELYKYYQSLIESGDKKGETREGLSKALELRERSIQNLIEIIKIKAKLIERKMLIELKNLGNNSDNGMKNVGFDNTDMISRMEDK